MTLFAFTGIGLGCRHCLLLKDWFDFRNHICIVWPPSYLSLFLSLKHMVLIINVEISQDYQLLTTFFWVFPLYSKSSLIQKAITVPSSYVLQFYA
jgi:hypothetical protein